MYRYMYTYIFLSSVEKNILLLSFLLSMQEHKKEDIKTSYLVFLIYC